MSDVDLVRRGFDAVARGDFDEVAELLDPGVRWHGAHAQDAADGCHNRDEALDFIRTALAAGTSVELLDVEPVGDRVVATLRSSERPEPHGELITVREQRIAEMVVYETPEAALDAARERA